MSTAGGLTRRDHIPVWQYRAGSPEEVTAVKQAVAALSSSARRQLMFRMSKLGKTTSALFAALV
jgi:hypothetical protein